MKTVRRFLLLMSLLTFAACGEEEPGTGSGDDVMDVQGDGTEDSSVETDAPSDALADATADTTADTAEPSDTVSDGADGDVTQTGPRSCITNDGCGPTERCNRDERRCECAAGFANCDGDYSNGCEVDLTSTETCGVSCNAYANCATSMLNVTGAFCTEQACDYEACAESFGDCDGNRLNGCELDLSPGEVLSAEGEPVTEIANCGACGEAGLCNLESFEWTDHVSAVACNEGVCEWSKCDDLWGDCDSDASNGCETSLNQPRTCGDCNRACLDDQFLGDFGCEQGVCEFQGCLPSWTDDPPPEDYHFPSSWDCDGDPGNYCETIVGKQAPSPVLGTSAELRNYGTAEHCGACGQACGLGGDCLDQETGDCSDVIQLAAGDGFTCAIREAPASELRHVLGWSQVGSFVTCWGRNDVGQLGNGQSGSSSHEPTLVIDADTGAYLESVVQIAAGQNHACALLADGTVTCWGAMGPWLGISGLTSDVIEARTVNISDVVQIVAGDVHTCARKSAGGVECWGSNTEGQLGTGDARDTNIFAPKAVDWSVSQTDKLAAGANHTCAVQPNANIVWCWGDNTAGQLGNGSTTDAFSPVQITSSTQTLGFFQFGQLALGGLHTCVIAETFSGTDVYCWGDNSEGQLGTGESASLRDEFGPALGQDSYGSAEPLEITADAAHTCVRTSGDELYCWGENAEAVLGQASDSVTGLPKALTPVLLSNAPDNLINISAGLNHICVVTDGVVDDASDDGSVWCWGSSDDGRIGVDGENGNEQPVPQNISNL